MADIIEGKNPVFEALSNGRPINKVLIARGSGQHTATGKIVDLSYRRKIPVEFVDRLFIDRLAQTSAHQGVIAYTSAKEYIAWEDLLVISSNRKEPPLYCILDGIEDPYNMGAIIRTAEASGTHGLIIRSRRAVGLTSTVAKAAAGAVEYVPVARVSNVSQTMLALKKRNVWIVGVDQIGGISYDQVDFTLPTAIVIGSEGRGLSDLVKQRCDSLASIPMAGNITSLNASIAAALVMYEAFRQRKHSVNLRKEE
ncbi:23S rRNA (guanosine(2251)-2'-O)-methyltransferase RlmB [Chloroflexota bacterium]